MARAAIRTAVLPFTFVLSLALASAVQAQLAAPAGACIAIR
ncbi:hypothetical protein PIB19_07260 [Sphingomonas sp. 7/4-4]|nr:hypothetical protein [Sphingomonas sp. 7/4-4]WBY09145.1 hypothetical protein PIB19_07260 [Sphingomonas sp. 7/4-4]